LRQPAQASAAVKAMGRQIDKLLSPIFFRELQKQDIETDERIRSATFVRRSAIPANRIDESTAQLYHLLDKSTLIHSQAEVEQFNELAKRWQPYFYNNLVRIPVRNLVRAVGAASLENQSLLLTVPRGVYGCFWDSLGKYQFQENE
jgi:hypothetical protein